MFEKHNLPKIQKKQQSIGNWNVVFINIDIIEYFIFIFLQNTFGSLKTKV